MPKQLTKRFLVTPEQYQQILQKPSPTQTISSDPYYIPHPNAREVKRTEDQLRDRLTDLTLPESDKVLLFSSELTKLFKDLTAALTVPKSTAILGTPPTTSDLGKEPSPAIQPNSVPISPAASSIKSPTPVKSPPPPETKSPPPTETKQRATRRLKFSTEKLLATYKDTDDLERAREFLEDLKKNEKIYWNEATGQVVINNRPLTGANIAGLVNDTLVGKLSLTSWNSFRTFRRALNP
jgi:hypothetical protein